MSSYLTVRVPKKVEINEAQCSKRSTSQKTSVGNSKKKASKYSNKKRNNLDGNCHHSLKTIHNSSFEEVILIDPFDTYIAELEKIQAIIPVDELFTSFIIPDFNIEKRQLLFTKPKHVLRRKVFLERNNDLYWLYCCSCDVIKKTFIEALPEVISEQIKEDCICIHISAVKMAVPDDDDIADKDEENTPNDGQGTFIKEIHFCNNKLLVVVNKDVGVIGFDHNTIKCSICDSNYCIHCEEVRKFKESPSMVQTLQCLDVLGNTPDEKLYSDQPLNMDLIKDEMIMLNKSPDQVFRKYKIDEEEMFIAQLEFGERCVNCSTPFQYDLADKSYTRKYLIYKSQVYSCAVFDLICLDCGLEYSYDGKSECVLHYGKYLIHHSVLRDYMFHFLNGNSCTLHGFYEVWRRHQEDNGNKNFYKILRYDSWRKIWYCYLKLVSDELSNSKHFQCPVCGPEPPTIVCDATSLGFQRKYLKFRKTVPSDNEVTPRMSKQDTRIALPNPEARNLLKMWSTKKLKGQDIHKLKKALTSFDPLYQVFLWVLESFPVVVPNQILRFFNSISQPSPVCAYVHPTEENFMLMESLFGENVKGNVAIMTKLNESLPLFYHVLSCMFESSLPRVWKPLIQELIIKSQYPFVSSKKLDNLPPSQPDYLEFFPALSARRGRGIFEMDKQTAVDICNKYYRGHPKLTPGIFTLFCPHGINYGFQVMRNVESPNVPFTIFKTRFQKGGIDTDPAK